MILTQDINYSATISLNVMFAFHHITYVQQSVLASRPPPADTVTTHQAKGSEHKQHLRSPTASCLPLSFLFGCTRGANETARIFLLSHVFCPVLKICVSCIKPKTNQWLAVSHSILFGFMFKQADILL